MLQSCTRNNGCTPPTKSRTLAKKPWKPGKIDSTRKRENGNLQNDSEGKFHLGKQSTLIT